MNKKMNKIKELRQTYESKIRQTLDSDKSDDQQIMFNDLDHLQADFGPELTKKFRELFSEQFLDLPPDDKSDYWHRSNLDGNYSLTDKGMNDAFERLRVRIREIEEQRSKKNTIWIGLFGAMTGLIAVATPLLMKLIEALM